MTNIESFGLSSLFSVEGKTVVITGGGSGLGKAIASGFAFNGAKVYIVGRRADVLKSAADEINAVTRGKVIPLPGDVGSKQRVDEFVSALQKLEDHVDVLINCAGINRPWKAEASQFDGQHNDPDAVEKLLWNGIGDDEFQSTYSINVNGVYFVSTRMVPLLRKSSAPTVIVIASIAGMMLQRTVGAVSYPISKAATLHCASVLASRFTPFKIRVNTILPGIFPSEMTGASSKPDLSDLIDSNPQAAKAVARCPAGRAGAETEIVGPCLLLASAAGGYMNNARLTIDGGRLMAAGSNDGVQMENWTYV